MRGQSCLGALGQQGLVLQYGEGGSFLLPVVGAGTHRPGEPLAQTAACEPTLLAKGKPALGSPLGTARPHLPLNLNQELSVPKAQAQDTGRKMGCEKQLIPSLHLPPTHRRRCGELQVSIRRRRLRHSEVGQPSRSRSKRCARTCCSRARGTSKRNTAGFLKKKIREELVRTCLSLYVLRD